ncbi:MAG: D-glycero-beta-D-manno-heptose-7-phosphate kinase [bacterium]
MKSVKLPSKNRLVPIIKRFPGRRILILGDIMLDNFIRGRVDRISPEAPVPVVHVQQESHVPGGGGNVAHNLAALEARVSLVSVVGTDDAGFKLLDALKSRGADVSGVIQDSGRPTTEKTRVIAEHQQVVRFDKESDCLLSASVQAECLEAFREKLPNCDAVLLSDYGKGILSSVNLKAIINACRNKRIPVCVDPKVEHFRKYRRVTCITPNTMEAWTGMGMHVKEDQPRIEELGRNILKKLSCESVLITQGEHGMTLIETTQAGPGILHIPARAMEVYDVTGAGDTVISVFCLALASGAALREAAVLSNCAAGVVVGKLGTATLTREELISAL